ncbi:MAG TPA: hypothetical protein VFP33_05315 [Gallionella sp.]|nr:hypothetical protein [Gallionella sp.]
MQRITMRTNHILALLFAGMFAAAPALADKPEWAGGGKPGKHEQQREGDQGHDKGDKRRDGDGHFDEHQRTLAHDYFAGQFRQGRCPPGLAKKHNGCLPPGQAKKWAMGQPLPDDVVFYDLPPRLSRELGPPPAGHRYVRVASDILLITVGTSMVVDAIEDLGRM